MRFITVSDLKSSSRKILKELPREKEMIIISNGKPTALLTPLSGQTMESAVRTMRRTTAAAAIEKLRSDSQINRTDTISDEEIEHEISLARRRG